MLKESMCRVTGLVVSAGHTESTEGEGDVYVKVHGYVPFNNVAQYLLLGHKAQISSDVIKSNKLSQLEVYPNSQTP